MLYNIGVHRKDRKRKWISEPRSELPLRGSLKSLWGGTLSPELNFKMSRFCAIKRSFKNNNPNVWFDVIQAKHDV
jgi:hypothetical protein